MKKMIFIVTLLVVLSSCEKTICTTCGIYTNAPGVSQDKTFCGTSDEISNEDNRLQSDCVVLQAAYPQYYFNCGCE